MHLYVLLKKIIHSIVCITTELQMFKERMKGNAIEKEREKKEKERKRERIST